MDEPTPQARGSLQAFKTIANGGLPIVPISRLEQTDQTVGRIDQFA
jgi:hypothetical protein